MPGGKATNRIFIPDNCPASVGMPSISAEARNGIEPGQGFIKELTGFTSWRGASPASAERRKY